MRTCKGGGGVRTVSIGNAHAALATFISRIAGCQNSRRRETSATAKNRGNFPDTNEFYNRTGLTCTGFLTMARLKKSQKKSRNLHTYTFSKPHLDLKIGR